MGWWVPKLTAGHWEAVVERRRELPREEARRMFTRANRAAFRDRRVYIPGGVAAVTLPTGLLLIFCHNGAMPVPEFIAAMVALAVANVMGLWFFRAHDLLTNWHIAAEFPTLCPMCGYDRRATPACCPECGSESPVAPTSRR